MLQETLVAQAGSLGGRLSAYSQHLEQTANASAQHIGYYVGLNRYQARDLAVFEQAELITRRADSIADSLHHFGERLAGTDAEGRGRGVARVLAGSAAGISATDLAALAAHLDRYVAFIQRYVPGAPPLTQPAAMPPEPVDFDRYYFSGLPAKSNQATLARLLILVRRYEADAMALQAQKVGFIYCGFDKIGAAAVPASGTVAPGSSYVALLLLAESSSGFYYKQMSANGERVRRFKGEQGLVEFAVSSPTNRSIDTLDAQWRGRITAALYPADSTWHLEVPYRVINNPRP